MAVLKEPITGSQCILQKDLNEYAVPRISLYDTVCLSSPSHCRGCLCTAQNLACEGKKVSHKSLSMLVLRLHL